MEEDMENNKLSKNTCQLEEDIKIIEELIDPFREQNRKGKKLILDIKGIKYEHYEAIENLIARYKELEENLNYRVRYCNILEKELYGENSVELTKLEDKYFIPKLKVQEKIEEQYERDWIFNEVRDEIIETLQELLED